MATGGISEDLPQKPFRQAEDGVLRTPGGWPLDSPLFKISGGYGEVGLIVAEVWGYDDDTRFWLALDDLAEMVGLKRSRLVEKIKIWTQRGQTMFTLVNGRVIVDIPVVEADYSRLLGQPLLDKHKRQLVKMSAEADSYVEHRSTKFRGWAQEQETRELISWLEACGHQEPADGWAEMVDGVNFLRRNMKRCPFVPPEPAVAASTGLNPVASADSA